MNGIGRETMIACRSIARSIAVFFALAASLAGATPASAREPSNRPNVIIIVSDDQGYNDVGFNGSTEIPTPGIDRIAHEGVRFSRGYVTFPVCGPSRAGLLTGRHQARFGFDRNPDNNPNNQLSGLPRSEEMISEYLKRGGYATMAIGKWHMGTHPTLRPLNRGFDEFYGFLEGGHRYMPEDIVFEGFKDYKKPFDWYRSKLVHNGERVAITKYLTDELSDQAVDFVRRKGPGEQPFFLYLAYNAPHAPLQATQEYLDRFPHIADPKRRTYAAMISAMDDGVGRVLAELDRQGIAEDTIVFFLSDNGGVVTTETGETPVADNSPLRGGKSQLFEGGVRVPFAMRWPDRFKGGADYSRPISSMDIFGTLAAVTGIPVRSDRPLDGVNLVPYLTGEKTGDPQPVLFFRKFDAGQSALVIGDLKYIQFKKYRVLFNLREDIAEGTNIGRGNRENLDKLTQVYEMWNAQMANEPAFPGLGNWPKPDGGRKTGAGEKKGEGE